MRAALAVLGLVAGTLLTVALPAAGTATQCVPPAVMSYDAATGEYRCTTPGGPGTPGDPGGDDIAPGPVEPTCSLADPYTYCQGTTPCYDEQWHPPFVLPTGPKPSPESKPMVRRCATGGLGSPPGVEIYWSDPGKPQPPSLAQQARTALGQLALEVPPLSTSPQGRTIVNLPTWFWLEGAQQEQTGSSAFGLVAIATVRELQVDPGDGSGGFTCPWVTSAEQAQRECTHTYDRASYDGAVSWQGRPAYEATARAVWSLRFEVNGTPVTIPGTPTQLPGPASTAVVRVDEVQTVVRRAG